MKTKLILAILTIATINGFAEGRCEYKETTGFDDSSLPAVIRSFFTAHDYISAYSICRTKKPIPTGSSIEFIFNNESYVQRLDSQTATFMTPQLPLLNDGLMDYFTIAVNLHPGLPNKYSYECEIYLCK